MLIKGNQIIDISLGSDGGNSYMTPIVGVENGRVLDYDRVNGDLYWVEGQDTQDNGTVYKYNLATGNRTLLLDPAKDTGIVGSPYTIAFDWYGRNLYIANKLAGNVELIKVDGKFKYRMIVLGGNSADTGVAKPIALALDPFHGKMYWVDEGGPGVPPKIGECGMDGSDPKVIVRDLVKPSSAFSVDSDKRMLYFTSGEPPVVSWGFKWFNGVL